MVSCAYNPNSGMTETGRSPGTSGQSLQNTQRVPSQWKTLFSKTNVDISWRTTAEVDLWPPQAHSYICTCVPHPLPKRGSKTLAVCLFCVLQWSVLFFCSSACCLFRAIILWIVIWQSPLKSRSPVSDGLTSPHHPTGDNELSFGA